MSLLGLLHQLFSSFCPENSALLTAEGEVLHLQTQEALSFGTLGEAARTVMKYLPLQVGDVALLNDPYSGGSTLNEYSFVTRLTDAGPQSLWWVWRRRKGHSLGFRSSVEDEGVRIPPTPVYQNKQLNQMILSAMAAHPLCPVDLPAWVEETCREMEKKVQLFQGLLRRQKIPLSKTSLRDYLQESRRVAREKVSESAGGETRVEIWLDSEEMIRLRIDIHEGQVQMDFTGTSASKTHLLTESATYGLCFAVLARHYGFGDLLNSGSFSILQVTKPSGCLLNAKYPAPLGAGAFAIPPALQTLLALGLSQIHTKKARALCAFCPLELEIKGASDESFFIRLPGGAGAGPEAESQIPFAGGEILNENFSVEKLESRWPLQIERIDFRNSSHGKGEFDGGRGLVLKLTATAPLELNWRTDLTHSRLRGPRGTSCGAAGEIELLAADGKEKTLPSMGGVQLRSGESMIFCSGTGGGWGQASAEK